jgi:hypothetical protein
VADLFLDYVWLGPVVWVVLYISDYSFTLTCARLYQAGAREKMAFEGSYEITPFYQKEVDALRRVSPRFILILVIGVIYLYLVAQTTARTSPNFFSFILGAFILVQLAIHIRHVRNYVLFQAMLTDAVRGRLEYSRPVLLMASSTELFTFAAMFAVMAIFTANPFALGGAVGSAWVGTQHRHLASKARRTAQVAQYLLPLGSPHPPRSMEEPATEIAR